jgi:4-oxalocrotonate tautomerase
MPFIHVKILEGTTETQKDELVQEMTAVFQRVVGVSRDRVFIFFEDLKKENYGKNGRLYSKQ